MLQQTRVETVIDYWYKWMEAMPSIHELSKAQPDAVNVLWSGLGYYSRAQRLLEGAQKVVQEYNGELPDTVSKLLEIPGIGPYTAGAISSIAFNKKEPLVDGNVIRVLTRVRGIKNEINPSVEKRIWGIARSLVDPEEPGIFCTHKNVYTYTRAYVRMKIYRYSCTLCINRYIQSRTDGIRSNCL